MNEVFKKIESFKIIPVLAINDIEKVTPLRDSLIEGGLPCVEITFRTENAVKAIRKMSGFRDILVGAGTVLNIEQAKAAIDAGAEFIVSPGLDVEIVSFCIDNKIAIAPGICTPSDITIALKYGLSVLKYFPAEAFGGVKTLKAMSAPFDKVKFIPTGGINLSNVLEYLNFPSVIACGGSWLVKSKLLDENKFDTITNIISETVSLIKECINGN